jgi:hypothetical protein
MTKVVIVKETEIIAQCQGLESINILSLIDINVIIENVKGRVDIESFRAVSTLQLSIFLETAFARLSICMKNWGIVWVS